MFSIVLSKTFKSTANVSFAVVLIPFTENEKFPVATAVMFETVRVTVPAVLLLAGTKVATAPDGNDAVLKVTNSTNPGAGV